MPESRADSTVAGVRALRPNLADAALSALSALIPKAETADADEALRWLHDLRPRGRIDWPALRSDPHPDDRILVRLADALALEDAELLACVLALRVEVDVLSVENLGRCCINVKQTGPAPRAPTRSDVAGYRGRAKTQGRVQ